MNEAHQIVSKEEANAKANKLPSWVKCVECGERPRVDDYLLEIIPNASALIHQSCAAEQGKIAGINVGKGE